MERSQKQEEKCIIVLRVFDGVNFRQEKPYRKIKLSASIGTQSFETETLRPVTPSTLNAKFDALFVWESDSYTVKCMKMENLPIKVECFELLPQSKWCRIGSVFIPLRNVPRVQLSRVEAMQPHGYRLTGIENALWRRQKPELKMQAMITDPKFLENPTDQQEPPEEDTNCNENPGTEPNTTIYANPSSGQLPENVNLLEDRGILQIGRNETDTDLFLLSITLKCASHLDRLIAGVDTFGLRYYLFGEVYYVHIEREQPNSAVFPIRETISIKIRSSLASLSDYLQDALKIAVDLLPERNRLEPSDAIGKSTIDFVGFLNETDLSEFIRKHANNEDTLEAVKSFPIFPVDGHDQNVRASSERLIFPSLKCKFSLRFLGNDNTDPKMEAESQKVEQKEHDEMHERESNLVVSPEMPSTASESTRDEQHQTVPTKTQATNSGPALAAEEKLLSQNSEKPITAQLETPAETLEKVDIATILLNTNQDLRDIRRTFAFSVQVGLIQFTTSPSAGLWQLTLQHPKADTPFTKVTLELIPDAVHLDRIDFGKITLKLFFSTLPERVMEVISSEPSKLTVNGPHGIHLVARLDNASLLVGNREQQSSGVVVMVDGSTGENVAIATVGCTLEEVGLNYNSQLAESGTIVCCHKTIDSGQPKMHTPFDENISYQLLEEQKAWMNEERERFLEELQKKERIHLQTLTRDWKVQRAEEEKRLADRLAQADAMVAALEEARCSLEDREHLDTQAERLRRQFRDQLEAIRSKAVRLEREAEVQIEATRKQCHELQEQLSALGADHQHLLDANLQLQRELDAERLNWDQERSELIKKIDDISASKLCYKEQWAKMMRKVHQLEQDLAVKRTPYYQPNMKEQRKPPTNRPGVGGAGGSQMSMISSKRRGAGDSSSCSFYKPPDSCL